jgi:membrane protease YdiL (CAAX protease family)
MIKKILRSTVVKIIIGFVVIMAAYCLPLFLLNDILRSFKEIQIARLIIIPIIAIILVLVSYIALYRYYESRKITELSTRNIGKYLLIGLLLGLLVPSLSILVAYLRGEYIILSISSLTNVFLRDLTISIGFGIATAVFEEVLFRGVLFRLIEEKLGSYFALLISSLIFGFFHLMNENSSFFAGFAISIISVLITVAYMYTRNLWFPIAIHFAMNFVQGDILGLPVSGDPASISIIVSQLEGSKWFTGGAWGIEATVQIMVFSLIAGIILLVLSHKKGNIIKQQVFKVKTE